MPVFIGFWSSGLPLRESHFRPAPWRSWGRAPMLGSNEFAINETPGREKMRAMRVHELSDDIDVLRLDDVTLPPPGPGELRLALKACSVNFPDILMVQGKYQFKPELPFSPGMEGAGTVAEVGE